MTADLRSLSDAEYAQSVLAPLAFRLACREGVGENVAIGEPLRRELERALSEAASRLDRAMIAAAGEAGEASEPKAVGRAG